MLEVGERCRWWCMVKLSWLEEVRAANGRRQRQGAVAPRVELSSEHKNANPQITGGSRLNARVCTLRN